MTRNSGRHALFSAYYFLHFHNRGLIELHQSQLGTGNSAGWH